MTRNTSSRRLNTCAAGFSAALVFMVITASAQNFPFPQHATCTAGAIKPNNVSQTTMDNEVITRWNSWKSNYLKPAGTGRMYVKFNSAGETVSEAHVTLP